MKPRPPDAPHRSTSIAQRIRASLVFLTLVPLVLVGGVGLFLGWSALSRSLSFLVEEVDALSRISSGISGYVQNRELALQGLAELSPLPAVDAAQRRRMLGGLLEQSQGLVRVAYHPLQGEETVAVLDPRWRSPGVDLERPSQAALAVALQGRRSRSRSLVQPPPGSTLLVLGQPVTRQGVVQGALLAWVDLEPALDLLRLRREQSHLAVWLVDGPTVLATSGTSAAGQRPFEGVTPGLRLAHTELGPRLEGAVPVSPVGWYLKWRYDLPEVSHLFKRMALHVGAAVALVGLLAWFLGGLVARRVAAPVEALSASTLALARGDYTAPTPDPGPCRELEVLTGSFEVMRVNLLRTLSENERLLRYTDGLLQARIQELQVLYNLSQASTDPRDAGSLVRLFMDHLQRLLPDSLQVLWLNERGELRLAETQGLPLEDRSALKSSALTEWAAGLENPALLTVSEAARHPAVGPRFPGRAHSGYCLVPLKVRGSLLGCLEVLAGPEEILEPGLVDLVAALAREVGLALENRQLYALSMAEKRFNQAVLEEMGEGVLTLDGQGRLATFNRAAERMTGWDRCDVIGRPCEEVFRLAEARHPLRELLRSGGHPAPFESEVTVRGGTRKVLLFNPTVPAPLAGAQEAPAAIVVFRDVSRIRELEDLRREVSANLSHELRTPLTAIKGYLATLLHPRAVFAEEPVRAHLRRIDQQVDVLNRLIGDLLEAARLRNAALEVHPRRVDLLGLLEDRVRKAGARSDHPIRLEVAGPLWAWCDPEHLAYVVDPLLSNALKFSPPGGEVVVRADREQGRVRIAIQDFGIGIPPHQMERIFEMFHRMEKGNTRIHYGLGVGLFIARRVVEAHGGTLTVQSTPGAGSTFLVCLPAAEGGADQAQ